MAMTLGNADLQAQGRGQGGQGGQGGRGNFDPAEMRARMMERYQEQLGFSDAEFKAIQPLIEDVQTKQREARGGRGGMMFGGRGGRGGRGGNQDADPELEALQSAIESGSNIEAKLAAFRAARDKKEADLKKAQDTLKSVLTVKQEAQAVLMGIIN
ncbi:MAG: hypothetical protein ACO3PR_05070 [Limisphaerales bacterium]